MPANSHDERGTAGARGEDRAGGPAEERDAHLALLALGGVFAITVAWWALALWPVPGGNPEWLERARVVCFNAGPDGLPDVSGWILLIGQPLGMFGFLLVVWPRPVFSGLRWAVSRPAGKFALLLAAAVAVGGLVGTGVRVSSAMAARAPVESLPVVMSVEEHSWLGQEPAPLGLVDQRGAVIDLGDLAGRPAVVTFAFGNCHDICPLVVQQARSARDAVWGPDGASLVVVTLDPWRDTPARLDAIASRWEFSGPHDHVLSGPVDEVQATLDQWNVARSRNPQTGDVAHPSLTYLLTAETTIAFATMGGREVMIGLAQRVEAKR